jgi:hypothetical protein
MDSFYGRNSVNLSTMARIILSGLVDDIRGKLGGSVVQQSNNVLIIRTKVSPRNPRSGTQQNRRSFYSSITRRWSEITQPQRDSWFELVTGYPDGIQRYIAANSFINMAAASVLDTFSAPGVLESLPGVVGNIDNTELLYQPLDASSELPTNTYLLCFASRGMPLGQSHISNQNCRFIHAFVPGDGNGNYYDIFNQYVSVWGMPVPDTQIFIQQLEIDAATGAYGPRKTTSGIVS